jgi:hypothetical protein
LFEASLQAVSAAPATKVHAIAEKEIIECFAMLCGTLQDVILFYKTRSVAH